MLNWTIATFLLDLSVIAVETINNNKIICKVYTFQKTIKTEKLAATEKEGNRRHLCDSIFSTFFMQKMQP